MNKLSVTISQLSVALLLSATIVSAQFPATTLCNTGLTRKSESSLGCLVSNPISPINPVDGGRIVDGNWTLATPYPTTSYEGPVPNPCTLPLDYSPAPVNTAWNAWYNPMDGLSQWIEPLGGGTTPPGWYVYRTGFLAPRAYEDYKGFILKISGQFMADDTAGAIYISYTGPEGSTCAALAQLPDTSDFESWTPFHADKYVLPSSVGYVYFLVYNDNSTSTTENPTGVRVEFTTSEFYPL